MVRARVPAKLGGKGPFVGTYASFSQVPSTNDGYNEDNWVNACLAEAAQLRDTDALDFWQLKSRELEPFVVALLAGQGPVRVVDFGGAIGFSYLLLKRRLAPELQVDYHVIDRPRICEAGRAFFANDGAIHFHESADFLKRLPPGGLLNVAGSLQYVDDWRGKLDELIAFRPRYALLTQLTAGEMPTFASLQRNMPGARVPHWFLQLDEVISHLEGLGYRLLYRGRCESRLNQIHHEPAQRIGHYRNLLFIDAHPSGNSSPPTQ